MSDDVLLAYARLFEGVPWERMLSTLAIVFSVCLAEGILTASEVQPIAAQLLSQSSASVRPLGIPVEDLFPTPVRSRADEINMLYLEIHHLANAANAASVDPLQEANYQACLSKLRGLQALEADEMAAYAESRRQLPRGALDEAMAHVRALLIANENSSS